MSEPSLPESPARNIQPAAAKPWTEAARAEFIAQRALKRLADEPEGAVVTAHIAKLQNFLRQASESIADRKGLIEQERKWLREAKGRRVTLFREVNETRRNRALSEKRRAELLEPYEKAGIELEHWTNVAKANIANYRADVERVKGNIRDLVVCWLLSYQRQWPGQRSPSYTSLRTVLGAEGVPFCLPKRSLDKLVSVAKTDVARSRGDKRWPFAAEMLRWLAEPDRTIGPEIP